MCETSSLREISLQNRSRFNSIRENTTSPHCLAHSKFAHFVVSVQEQNGSDHGLLR
jgi:hypothetical protein